MGERHEQFRQLKKDLENININKGGGAERGLKGFYAEYINSTYSNLERIDRGIAAREMVIADNGDWDSVILYAKGATGRPIQDKVGYQLSDFRKRIESGQYDDGIFRINPDHPIFSDKNKLDELSALSKEHGIKIVKGNVTETEVKRLAVVASKEGKIRTSLGMDNTAPITTELYVDSKEFAYTVEKGQNSIAEVNTYIYSATNEFLSENAARINAAGLEQAQSAIYFAAAMSIGRNTIAVLKEDEEFSDGAKDVIKDVTSAAVMGYATGAVKEAMGVPTGDASLLINGTIQLSKQVLAYADGEIDEEQLLEDITATSAQLAAAYVGRMVGCAIGSIGGPIGVAAGQFIGEMISTAVCSEIMSAMKAAKEAERQNAKVMALYRNAQREIEESQARLEALIQRENEELMNAFSSGMEKIVFGIWNGSYDEIESGLNVIGEEFGLTLEDLQKDKITLDSLFDEDADVIVID